MRNFYVAAGVGFVHIFTGLLIFASLDPSAITHTTPIAIMSRFLGSPYVTAAVLISVGIPAIIPMLKPGICRLGFILLVAPQQVLLFTHAASAIWSISVGHYADGYVPAGGSLFIFADQIWLLTLVAFHTVEYMRTHEEEF